MKLKLQNNLYRGIKRPIPHSWRSTEEYRTFHDPDDGSTSVTPARDIFCRMCGSEIHLGTYKQGPSLRTKSDYDQMLAQHNQTAQVKIPEDCYEAQQLYCCRKIHES